MADKPNGNESKSTNPKAEQRKAIAGAIVTLFLISFFIDPWVFVVVFVLFFAVLVLVFWQKAKKQNASSVGQQAIAQPRIQLLNRDPNELVHLPDTFEREVDALSAPDIVKHKIRKLGDEAKAYHVVELMDYPETPDVLKKYIAKGPAEVVEGFDSDGCHVTDSDGLYDADQYESVNQEFGQYSSDVMLVNGKPVNAKKKNKNPFEM